MKKLFAAASWVTLSLLLLTSFWSCKEKYDDTFVVYHNRHYVVQQNGNYCPYFEGFVWNGILANVTLTKGTETIFINTHSNWFATNLGNSLNWTGNLSSIAGSYYIEAISTEQELAQGTMAWQISNTKVMPDLDVEDPEYTVRYSGSTLFVTLPEVENATLYGAYIIPEEKDGNYIWMAGNFFTGDQASQRSFSLLFPNDYYAGIQYFKVVPFAATQTTSGGPQVMNIGNYNTISDIIIRKGYESSYNIQ